MSEFSWVTLATNDSYSLGALVLAHSLKRVGTRYQLVVMVTPGVTQLMREKLAAVFDLVFEVNILDSKDERNLLLLQRPELGITFTKLHCWRLTQFKKCVFLDADTLVLQNCDELFERDEFSAAPDVGWPDCFNSGVFVYKPSDETFNSLLTFALQKGSFDGGDQGLLNLYFSDWAHKDISKHLPFIYNMCSTACYSYLPAFKQFGENVKIVHFIGNSKPWLQYFNSENLQVTPTPGFNHLQVIFDHWWSLFCAHVHSNLATSMARIDSHIASSCTSSSHSFFHPVNESKCEDSPCTAQTQNNTEINIPIWDPWENYNPIQNQINDTPPNHNISLVVDNDQPTFVETSSFDTKHNSSNYSTDQLSIEQKHSCFVDNFNSNSNEQQTIYIEKRHSHFEHNVNTSEKSHISNVHVHVHIPESPPHVSNPIHNFPITKTEVHNQQNVHIPKSPLYVSNPIHNIPITKSEVHNSQNACASCQTVKSATEQPNNTVTESTNNEKGTDKNGGLAGAFAQMTLREPKSASQGALEEHLRRQGWEAGRIDYLGQDSFDNVWKKICETIAAAPAKEPTPPKELPVKQPSPPKQIVEQPAPIKEPSPPKQIVEQPVKEPSPPKQVEVQASAPAAAPESTPAPVVAAPESAPACVAPPASTPETPAQVATPTEAPVAPTPDVVAPVAPAPETPVAPAPETPVSVAPTPEAPVPVVPTPAPVEPTPAPVAPTPEAPTPETPAPVASTPETPAPATPTSEIPAPVVPTPETPAPAAPTSETPAPAEPTPEASTPVAPETPAPVAPVPESKAAPETVSPATPTPVPETTTPVTATEPAAPVAPIAEPPAPATPAAEPVTTAPAAVVATPEKTVETPAPSTEAPKQTETKAEEQKPKEESKSAPEAAAAAVPPPTITETPATPQTPDASKGEIKPAAAAAAVAASAPASKTAEGQGQSSEVPVPPPRKSGKNGGGQTKKSSKKK